MLVFGNTVYTIAHHYGLECELRYQRQQFYKYSLGGGGLFSLAQSDWFSDNFHPINSKTIHNGFQLQHDKFSVKYPQEQSHTSSISVNCGWWCFFVRCVPFVIDSDSDKFYSTRIDTNTTSGLHTFHKYTNNHISLIHNEIQARLGDWHHIWVLAWKPPKRKRKAWQWSKT